MPGHPENEQPDPILANKEMLEIFKAAFRSRDVEQISQAIGTAAKAHNVAEVARRAGITRTSVYQAFAGQGAYPNLTTVVRVLEAIGLELKVRQIRKRGKGLSRSSRR